MIWSRAASLRAHLALVAMVAALNSGSGASAADAGSLVPTAPAPNEATGNITGRVVSKNSHAIAGADVTAASPLATFHQRTDRDGRYAITNVPPDTYTISVQAGGFESATQAGITVVAPAPAIANFELAPPQLTTIGGTRAVARSGTVFGQAVDSFTVNGQQAQGERTGTGSGLGSYTQGTVLGAVSNIPGVVQDQFSDLIARGSKVTDSIFEYDGVPFPQEIIANPGGTTFGPQLSTIGIGSTFVTQAGFGSGGNSALGAIVNQVPISGSYPGSTSIGIEAGLGSGESAFEFTHTGANGPNGRLRYAIAARTENEGLELGPDDGGPTDYLTTAAGGFALDFTHQATNALMANVHYRVGERGDLEVLGLYGSANFLQYGSPGPGLYYGNTDGLFTGFPNTSPYQPSGPSTDGGNYSLQKVQYSYSAPESSWNVRLSRGQNYGFSNQNNGSDLQFPLGFNSLLANQYNQIDGFELSAVASGSSKHLIEYGSSLQSASENETQTIPLLDDITTVQARSNSIVSWLADTFSLSDRLQLFGSLRLTDADEIARAGHYEINALDPHIGAAYRVGTYAIGANYDHISQLPQLSSIDRIDTIVGTLPFTPLGPERGNHYTFSISGNGATRFRVSYFAKLENNRLDVIPASLAVQNTQSSGASASAIGLTENLGDYQVHGVDVQVEHGPMQLTATYARTFGIDSQQYATTQVNPTAIAAGLLFPANYAPDLNATFSYRFHRGRTTITPQLSYESGYPYGVGTKTVVAGPSGQPTIVNNDNFYNPGASYYFLRNPAQPFNAATNPYIANLGTPEGAFPGTLRSNPRTFVGLRIEHQFNSRLTLHVDVTNLLNFQGPIQNLNNPYMIGPPGYTGGNPLYAAYYAKLFSQLIAQYRGLPYILGNGIPTLDGYHPEFSNPAENYGTGPYVGASFPYRRQVVIGLSYAL
jgi:hypothetical protein